MYDSFSGHTSLVCCLKKPRHPVVNSSPDAVTKYFSSSSAAIALNVNASAVATAVMMQRQRQSVLCLWSSQSVPDNPQLRLQVTLISFKDSWLACIDSCIDIGMTDIMTLGAQPAKVACAIRYTCEQEGVEVEGGKHPRISQQGH